MFNDNPEVLIAGAGPVGLLAALTLAKRGIQVQIVDTGVWACTHTYALAVHPDALALLDKLGAGAEIRAKSCPVRSVGLYDASSRRAAIQLGSGELAVLGQDAIEEALERALRGLDVRVQWRHEAIAMDPGDDDVLARVDRFEKESRGYVVAHTEWVLSKSTSFEVPYVIGADGYNSRVRETLGIDFNEVAPPLYYAVFEFKSDADLGGEMRVILSDTSTDVLWPLPNGYCRWSFELPASLVEGSRVKDRSMTGGDVDSPALDEANLRRLIAQRAPWFEGSIEGFSFRILARFERRLAARFGRGRMWLVGDAAHLTGPVGVQSMNVGFLEAHELAECVGRAITNSGEPGELEAWDARWTAEWNRLLGIGASLKPRPGVDPWIARHARSLMACIPAHGEELARLAGQVGLDVVC